MEVRLHSFFLLLLILSVTWSTAEGLVFTRGLVLWLLLLVAVAVREVARTLAAAWFSLDLRSVLLLPTGGIFTYANPESLTRASSPRIQRRMALIGPVASFGFGVILIAIILTIAPSIDLYSLKWVTPAHLLRTLVWVNLLLGAVNLLPAWPLDAGRVMRSQLAKLNERSGSEPDPVPPRNPAPSRAELARLAVLRSASAPASVRVLATLGPAIALVLVFAGLLSMNWWFIMAGVAIFLGAQIERQSLLFRADVGQVLVRDVMLTDYSVLPASSTLEDALERARHSLQDVFPVVRGGMLVGAIGRGTILENMQINGNSYIQGLMTRSFPTANPGEPILQALGRFTAPHGQAAQLIAVVEGARIVGIITPQNLQRSMSILPAKPSGSPAATARD